MALSKYLLFLAALTAINVNSGAFFSTPEQEPAATPRGRRTSRDVSERSRSHSSERSRRHSGSARVSEVRASIFDTPPASPKATSPCGSRVHPMSAQADYSSESATPSPIRATRARGPLPAARSRISTSTRSKSPRLPQGHVPHRKQPVAATPPYGTITPSEANPDIETDRPHITRAYIQRAMLETANDPDCTGLSELLTTLEWSYGFIESSRRGTPRHRHKSGDLWWDGPRAPVSPHRVIPKERLREVMSINKDLFHFLPQYDEDKISPSFMVWEYGYRASRKADKKHPSSPHTPLR